jgi:tripartite-type tricarboxylate transporter receptor subunit TctC
MRMSLRLRAIGEGLVPTENSVRMGRYKWLCLLAAAVLSASTFAQQYPDRPLRLIVPFPPGGGTDIIGRTVAGKLGEYLGQTVLVDNRPGANTIIAAEIAAKAAPDGYTLLFAPRAMLVLNPVSYKKLSYDPLKDFAPVAKLSEYAYYIVVRNGFPPRSVPEFVAYAKANPGKITYGTSGEGSSAHFGAVLLESMAGIKLVHIPYKGNAPTNMDMMGERLDINLTGLPSIEPLVRAGKMRLLAFGGDKRDPLFPDVPTVAESGYPGYWVGTWFSIVTRAGTPRPIVLRLNREINRALQAPDVQKPLLENGYELANGTPEDLETLIRSEIPRLAKIAKDANISFD